jgi:cell fate regulator YaaT (PSP1 superfamily)
MPKYIVRHGVMRNLGVFASRGSDVFLRGVQVIARTSRGLEVGEVLCEAAEDPTEIPAEQRSGQILRATTADDSGELRRLLEQQRVEFEACRRHIERLRLDMKLVDVERIYGGERVVVYYLADERVDFRQLVKDLASEFQTRVEMKQIGVRDEAKLLADYGDCGKPVCCNTHLSEMPPVSMRMAKLQKATLDPSKISGRCGRLKCCLRYEYDTYQELQRDLPPVGAEIITQEGRGKVLAQEILAGRILVAMEDQRHLSLEGSAVLTVLKKANSSRKQASREENGKPPVSGDSLGDSENSVPDDDELSSPE